jgi:hypothetical protein
MSSLNYFISKKKIDYDTKLKYLIAIPCVNRTERSAINVIERTFDGFKNSGMFDSDICFKICLFESGSKDVSYLDFIKKYEKNPNYEIEILYSSIPLNGNSNTLKMFYYLNKLPENSYDFIIWMDDDVYVCKKFLENADIWIKNYANFSLFSSLYVPYNSLPVPNKKFVKLADLPGFYGTCCTIFKPKLSKYVIPTWYDNHFEKFSYNPDTRFRDGLRKHFPMAKKICVSYPSLVQHMNIGSAIKQKIKVNKGHRTNNFIGEDNDPMYYLLDKS